jgi:hypothetical protein
VVLDSRKQWRAEHADYQKTYWPSVLGKSDPLGLG